MSGHRRTPSGLEVICKSESESAPNNTTVGDLTAVRAAVSGVVQFGSTAAIANLGAAAGFARVSFNGGISRIDIEDGSSNLWEMDVSSGDFRIFVPGVEKVHLATGGIRFNGYARGGSISAPANTTAGDLTATRLSIGNVAFGGSAGAIAHVQGTMTDTDAAAHAFAFFVNTINPASNSSTEFRSLYFQNLPSAAAGITLSNIQAGHIENRIRQTGAITDVYAALLQAIVVDSSSPATPGTVTTARALSLGYWGRPSGTSTQTVTNVLGIEMAAGRVGSGVTITTMTDMSIANPSAPTALTNHYGIDIAALTRASSVNVGIRNQAELRQTAVAMFGGDQTASARVHISEPTLGNEVFRIESVATNDDPSERVFQNRVATTDATVTTLHTYTIPASTTVRLVAHVVARRTSGGGNADDGASYTIVATVKNAGGTAALIGGSVNQLTAQEDQPGWDATIDVASATARVRVTGAASTSVTWHLTLHVFQVGS